MNFQIHPIPTDFSHYFNLTAQQLSSLNAAITIVDSQPGFPCRVSLEDATPGERILAISYTHMPGSSPYRASGPIFVRENAQPAQLAPNEVPAMLRSRLLSLRAYNHRDYIICADTCEGDDLEKHISKILQNKEVTYIHLHFARPGCFCCQLKPPSDRLNSITPLK